MEVINSGVIMVEEEGYSVYYTNNLGRKLSSHLELHQTFPALRNDSQEHSTTALVCF
jgi:hypothetical protein